MKDVNTTFDDSLLSPQKMLAKQRDEKEDAKLNE